MMSQGSRFHTNFVAWCNRGSVWENGDSSYFAGQIGLGDQHPQDNPRAGVDRRGIKMWGSHWLQGWCEAPRREMLRGISLSLKLKAALETRGPGGGRCNGRVWLTHVNTVWLPLRKGCRKLVFPSGADFRLWTDHLGSNSGSASFLTNFGQVASPVLSLVFSSVKWVY